MMVLVVIKNPFNHFQSFTPPKVEKSEFCRKVFQARIADGLADAGPIWEDVTRVQPEQLGESTGLLAGFPCQAGFTELASSQI